jgi:hypothetical protein
VRRLHLDRRDRQQQRGGEARGRPRHRPPEQEREEDAGHAERRHHGPRGEVALGRERRAVRGAHEGQQQVEDEPGVLVEAMVEVAAREHAADVLHEELLVDVRGVPQA